MPERTATHRFSVAVSAVCAAAVTVLSCALAAGLHHATAGTAVSPAGLAQAAALLFCGAFLSFRFGSLRTGPAVLAVAQAVLPGWLTATEAGPVVPGGHQALPPAWHHNLAAMAALNLAAALLCAWLLRDAGAMPSRVVRACAAPARQWVARVGVLLRVRPARHEEPGRPWHRVRTPDALVPQTAHVALRHQLVPCGP
ncbi:hypothetical protein ACFXKG_24755 [Streptomyces sp. NPDC059255]|uniref:hypothetical protein n=1 Tax=Streptomyces sp. NPDC059255 TaxID=3346793 RepID=UPI0036A95D9D